MLFSIILCHLPDQNESFRIHTVSWEIKAQLRNLRCLMLGLRPKGTPPHERVPIPRQGPTQASIKEFNLYLLQTKSQRQNSSGKTKQNLTFCPLAGWFFNHLKGFCYELDKISPKLIFVIPSPLWKGQIILFLMWQYPQWFVSVFLWMNRFAEVHRRVTNQIVIKTPGSWVQDNPTSSHRKVQAHGCCSSY